MGKKKKKRAIVRDKHLLYSAAVQSVEADLDFFKRIYKRKRGERFRLFREDFCGTAALACEWVRRRKDHESWGVDLDRRTLDWGIKHNLAKLGSKGDRVHLICDNVLAVDSPRVQVVAALNFSYSVFKTRELLREYFTCVRRSLLPGGIFFLDTLGGTEAMEELKENRRIPAEKAFDGRKVPPFTYTWEQVRFNPVNHDLYCQIHFKLADGTKVKRAFVYDWRLWTLPELQELMLEAGFASAEVYLEGWDEDEDDTDGIFRRRTSFENQTAWVAYVVGFA